MACGQTACGADNNTYLCNDPGGTNWTFESNGCGGGADAGTADAGCSCDGTDVNGPINVACGQTACGSDNNTYTCNSPGGTSGWSYQAAGCGGGADAGTADAGCSCDGTDANGPINVACGQTACGSWNNNTYTCNSPGGTSGWSYQASGCNTCSCNGTDANGPINVACGQMACGADNNTYLCNSPGGTSWTFNSDGCGSTDAGSDSGSGGACQCTGTGPGGGPLTVNCGDNACGSDGDSYLCNSPGGTSSWTQQGQGCAGVCPNPLLTCGSGKNCGTMDDGCGAQVWCGGACSGSDACVNNPCTTVCQCQGTGPGGVPITAGCGTTACGSDNNTYTCNSPGGSSWTLTSNGCP